jgi:neurabin
MDKASAQQQGQKVSQIANIFQRKALSEEEKEQKEQKDATGTVVVRTESHAARFNNARALFERLGEGRINRPTIAFSIKHSTSKDDNLKDPSPERQQETPSPPMKKYVTNGVGSKIEGGVGLIQNVSRLKSEKPEKPEKPERKFNSKELIEKQKNWTSHFSKSRNGAPTTTSARCDIIRTVPGTGVINNAEINKVPEQVEKLRSSKSSSIESPPSPSKRQSTSTPPEIKPRTTSRSNSLTSPQRLPDVAKVEENNLGRKKSFDYSEQQPPLHTSCYSPDSRRQSNSDKESSLTSPAHAISSTPSPAASSSGPSSPVHTEDEKQENESNEKEKTELLPSDDGEFIRFATPSLT